MSPVKTHAVWRADHRHRVAQRVLQPTARACKRVLQNIAFVPMGTTLSSPERKYSKIVLNLFQN